MLRYVLLPACAMALMPPAAAEAATKATYAGTWAGNLAQCKIPQDDQNAPMVLSADRYDQHEVHCVFSSVAKTGTGWRVKAKCTVEGDEQRDAFSLKVTGDTLVITRGRSAQVLRRCG